MKDISFYLSILLVMVYIKRSISIEYVPPNQIIEAIQNDRYTFGIGENGGEIEIARCTFSGSNNGTEFNHSFNVRPTYSNDIEIYKDDNISPDLFENVITDRGIEGLCQIVVANVQDTGPKSWNLIATDFDKKVVVNTTFTVDFYYKGPLLEYGIQIMETASFVNYVIIPDDLKIVTCYLLMNDTTKIDLDMQTPRTNMFISNYTTKAEDLAKRVTSLGFGYCGMKFTNTTASLQQMRWSLTFIDDQGHQYRGKFTTRVDAMTTSENLRTIIYVLLGSKISINCLNPFTSLFCSIFDNNGVLVEATECQHVIPSFTMDHVGEWKCYNGFGNRMDSVEYKMEMRARYPEKVIQWVNETENYVNIGCAIENYRGRLIQYCELVAPNERTFNVRTSFATERYLPLGTNFQTATCAIMIRKPLQEFEKGLWRCEIGLRARETTGTYIAVKSTTPATYPKNIKLTTRLNEEFEIFCNVPHYSAYCRIVSPNQTVYLPEKPTEVTLGRCSITVKQSSATDNGTWTCLFAQATGVSDDEIFVDVTISQILRYYKSVDADVGDDVELICTTGGLPLAYCRYISNLGIGYHIDDRVSNPSGISYHGRGLEYGECGIRIPNIQLRDSGYWTCATRAAPSASNEKPGPELTARTMLNIASPTTLTGPNIAAIGIGSAVGVIIVTLIFGIMGKQKWNRRRHTEVEGTTRPTRRRHSDSSSQNSGSNIFNMESAPRPHRSSQQPRPTNNDDDDEINVFSMEELPRSSRDPQPGSSRISNRDEEQEERL